MCDWREVEFGSLMGEILEEIERDRDDERLVLRTRSGRVLKLEHSRDCCEYVTIEDICGDIADVIGSQIRMAEESTSGVEDTAQGIQAWTFYKLGTARGDITIRWYGSSNGYYSVGVSCLEDFSARRPSGLRSIRLH